MAAGTTARVAVLLSHALRDDFSQRLHVFCPSVLVNDRCTLARDMSGGERLPLENAVQDLFHTKSEAIGLGEAGDFRFAIARTQNRCELTISVNALVVHLDGNNPFKLLENFLEAVRQWVEMAQMKFGYLFSLCACHCDGVVDRSVG